MPQAPNPWARSKKEALSLREISPPDLCLGMLHAPNPWVLQPPADPSPRRQPVGHRDFVLAKLDALEAAFSTPAFLNGAGSMRGMRGGRQRCVAPHGSGFVSRGVAFLAGSPATLPLRLGGGDLKCL